MKKVRTNVIFKINNYENGSIAVQVYVFIFLCPTTAQYFKPSFSSA
jgi:hypothetical protein